MTIAIYFGRVVRKLREELRYSQEVLADRANLNRTYLGEVERGAAMPSLATIAKISKALNIPASRLIERAERHEALSIAQEEQTLLRENVSPTDSIATASNNVFDGYSRLNGH